VAKGLMSGGAMVGEGLKGGGSKVSKVGLGLMSGGAIVGDGLKDGGAKVGQGLMMGGQKLGAMFGRSLLVSLYLY
jgi:hypothetical protein